MGATLVPGCGSPTPDTAQSSVPIDDFISRVSKIICDNLAQCCPAAQLPFDSASCTVNAQRSLHNQYSALDFSRVRFESSVVERCLSGYASWLSSCVQSDSSAEALLACNGLIVGTVPLGGACRDAGECAPPANGAAKCQAPTDSTSSEGTCASYGGAFGAASHGKQGDACDGSCAATRCDTVPSSSPSTIAVCFDSDGLFCADKRTCQPLLADGAACTVFGCGTQSYCNAVRVCAPKQPNGASCSLDSDCASSYCPHPADPSSSAASVCAVKTLADSKTCASNFD